MNTCNFLQDIANKKYDIIIFGAGLMGSLVNELCQSNNIEVACFLDNNPHKKGKKKDNVLIYSIDDICNNYKNSLIIISPTVDSVQQGMIKQLSDYNLNNYYLINDFIKNVSINNIDDVLKKIQLHKLSMINYKNKDSDIIYIETLNFSITERCSLKCKDCCHLMQYYEKPKDYKKEDLFLYLDRIDEVVDIVSELPILGGEPFINPDVYDIVSYAQTKDSIKHILILTNATILPKKEELLKFDKNKVGFAISSYNNLSIKTTEFCNMLDELGFSYKCDYATQWGDSANISYQNYSDDDLKSVFKTCYAKWCTAISYGVIYICPFLAHTTNLKAVPKDYIEGIDIMDISKSIDRLKSEINNYIYGLEYLNICQYCSGKSAVFNTKNIEPAIQTKDVLSYKKYE